MHLDASVCIYADPDYVPQIQGFPQSVQASRHHDALIFYPDASVSAVTL